MAPCRPSKYIVDGTDCPGECFFIAHTRGVNQPISTSGSATLIENMWEFKPWIAPCCRVAYVNVANPCLGGMYHSSKEPMMDGFPLRSRGKPSVAWLVISPFDEFLSAKVTVYPKIIPYYVVILGRPLLRFQKS